MLHPLKKHSASKTRVSALVTRASIKTKAL